MAANSKGLRTEFEDVWLLGGKRTPFIDYTGAFGLISPIDLGIKAARAAIADAGVSAADIDFTVAGGAYSRVRRRCLECILDRLGPFFGRGDLRIGITRLAFETTDHRFSITDLLPDLIDFDREIVFW